MRKNSVKRTIKKVSKKAQRNPEATIAITATTTGFAVFGVIESAIIIKNKTKAKIEEIKAKKEAKKSEDSTKAQQPEQTEQVQQPAADNAAAKNNNEGAEA